MTIIGFWNCSVEGVWEDKHNVSASHGQKCFIINLNKSLVLMCNICHARMSDAAEGGPLECSLSHGLSWNCCRRQTPEKDQRTSGVTERLCTIDLYFSRREHACCTSTASTNWTVLKALWHPLCRLFPLRVSLEECDSTCVLHGSCVLHGFQYSYILRGTENLGFTGKCVVGLNTFYWIDL